MSRNTAIKSEELTPELFIVYCKLYIADNMYKQIPVTSQLNYNHISMLMEAIDDTLFRNINTETGKLLLANKIYSLVMRVSGEEFSREFLYKLADDLSQCMPEFEEERDYLKELERDLDEYIFRSKLNY